MSWTDTEITQPLTQIKPPLSEGVPPVTQAPNQAQKRDDQASRSLLRSSGTVAVASLISRVTGFIRNIALVSILGFAALNDAYTISNTLPNVVYELLIGGVLSSVMIPILIRAQGDTDGGEKFTRKLLTVTGAALLIATTLAVIAAPLLTHLLISASEPDTASPELATAFAWLLLPQIFFYGMGALLGAVLNSRQIFGPFAWAPVLNNIVVLTTLTVYALLPGEISINPVVMGEPKLLVLGLGTTLGVVAQTLLLLPYMKRIEFHCRPLWGWDSRLSQASGMALWVAGYVAIGQIGYVITTRIATAADAGSVVTYTNAWLLLQVPYGVLGVSLLTALMPRLSRAAASADTTQLANDFSLGVRLSTLALVPVTAVMTAFGDVLGIALFSIGAGSGSGAERLGLTVAWSAFGILPYAIMMLQIRIFYAQADSRTPTLIQLWLVLVKIPLLLLCPVLLSPAQVVIGIAVVNSLSFIWATIASQWLLHRKLGGIPIREVLDFLWRVSLAAGLGAGVARGVLELAAPLLATYSSLARAWALLFAGTLIALPLTFAALKLLRTPGIDALLSRKGRVGAS